MSTTIEMTATRSGAAPAPPAPPPDVVGTLLRAASRLTVRQGRALRSTRLSPSAFTVLVELGSEPDGALQPCALAAAMAVTRPSICGLIDGLETKGLVERTPHRRDGRRVLVRLTAAGHALLDRHVDDYRAALDTSLAPLDGAERGQLVTLLRRIGGERSESQHDHLAIEDGHP